MRLMYTSTHSIMNNRFSMFSFDIISTLQNYKREQEMINFFCSTNTTIVFNEKIFQFSFTRFYLQSHISQMSHTGCSKYVKIHKYLRFDRWTEKIIKKNWEETKFVTSVNSSIICMQSKGKTVFIKSIICLTKNRTQDSPISTKMRA